VSDLAFLSVRVRVCVSTDPCIVGCAESRSSTSRADAGASCVSTGGAGCSAGGADFLAGGADFLAGRAGFSSGRAGVSAGGAGFSARTAGGRDDALAANAAGARVAEFSPPPLPSPLLMPPLPPFAFHPPPVNGSVEDALRRHPDALQRWGMSTCCSVLQCVAVRYSVLHCVRGRCLETTCRYCADVTYVNMLQCVAVCCSVLQCVAVFVWTIP